MATNKTQVCLCVLVALMPFLWCCGMIACGVELGLRPCARAGAASCCCCCWAICPLAPPAVMTAWLVLLLGWVVVAVEEVGVVVVTSLRQCPHTGGGGVRSEERFRFRCEERESAGGLFLWGC